MFTWFTSLYQKATLAATHMWVQVYKAFQPSPLVEVTDLHKGIAFSVNPLTGKQEASDPMTSPTPLLETWKRMSSSSAHPFSPLYPSYTFNLKTPLRGDLLAKEEGAVLTSASLSSLVLSSISKLPLGDKRFTVALAYKDGDKTTIKTITEVAVLLTPNLPALLYQCCDGFLTEPQSSNRVLEVSKIIVHTYPMKV